MMIWPKAIRLPFIGLVLVIIAGGPIVASAATPKRISAGTPSKIYFDGDSTLHKYSVKATSFVLNGQVAGLSDDVTAATIGADLCRGDATLTVPVRKLKSGKDGLDENLYKTLDAKRYPNIVYRFQTCTAKRRADGSYDVEAQGTLQVAAKTQPLRLMLTAKQSKGQVRLQGSKRLQMTDFGVKPPELFLGTLKTADEIDVFFDLVVRIAD